MRYLQEFRQQSVVRLRIVVRDLVIVEESVAHPLVGFEGQRC